MIHPLIFINNYKSETFSTHLHITKGKRALLSSSKVSGKGKSDLFSINNHISSEEYKLKKNKQKEQALAIISQQNTEKTRNKEKSKKKNVF